MPFAIIIRWPAWVGKSTVAEQLQKEFPNIVHLDIDKFKHLISQESSNARTNIAHSVGLHFLQQLVENEYNIIVEEVFRESYFASVKRFFEKTTYTFITVYIGAPLETVIQRDKERQIKTKGETVITKLWNQVQPLNEDVHIDNSKQSLGNIMNIVKTALAEKTWKEI